MQERSSPIQRGFYLFLHLAVQIEDRLPPSHTILDAGQVDEQRPL